MNFKHILATRFNLSFNSLEKDKNNQSTRDAEWMEHRIALFSKFCARSVCSQNNKNFVWLILIDQNTEQHWEDSIKKSISSHINALIVRCGPYPSWDELIRPIVSIGQFYVMTRLDNDDSISRNFIDIIQKNVPDLIDNFSNGVVGLDFSDGVEFDGSQFYPLTQHGSNFSSIVTQLELGQTARSIYDFPHRDLTRLVPTTVISLGSENPMWCQNIHDRNAKNIKQAHTSGMDGQNLRYMFCFEDEDGWTSNFRMLQVPPDGISLDAYLTKSNSHEFFGPKNRARIVDGELRIALSSAEEIGLKISGPEKLAMSLTALIENPHPAAKNVCFFVATILADGSTSETSTVVAGGSKKLYTFDLFDLASARDLRVGARLENPESTAAYAWPMFREPYMTMRK